MSAGAQPNPDLHFDCSPLQIGDKIMVRVQIADNFGVTFQLVLPPEAARAFGKYLCDAALKAGTTLVKPLSMLAEN
jgi:hypothetical protein